jgi:hypothetical protein
MGHTEEWAYWVGRPVSELQWKIGQLVAIRSPTAKQGLLHAALLEIMERRWPRTRCWDDPPKKKRKRQG